MTVKGIHHVAYRCRDTRETVDFYRDLLGMEFKLAMGRDENTPEWVQHIAFEVGSFDELMGYKSRLEAAGLDVLGPTNHGIFDSIYFFDPNGHRLELAANKGTDEQLKELKNVADDMVDEWSVTKRAPAHAAWVHELE